MSLTGDARCTETFKTIATDLNVPVSPSKAAQGHQQAAITAGLADQDASVVMTIMERLTAVEVPRGGGGGRRGARDPRPAGQVDCEEQHRE